MSTLVDRSLHRIRIKDEHVEFAEGGFVGKRIRYVHQHGEGRLVLWTDDREIIFLNVDEHVFIVDFVD
ncbi:MAG: hypothetical protein ACXWVS_12535 [Hyphomicrobium sp.]